MFALDGNMLTICITFKSIHFNILRVNFSKFYYFLMRKYLVLQCICSGITNFCCFIKITVVTSFTWENIFDSVLKITAEYLTIVVGGKMSILNLILRLNVDLRFFIDAWVLLESFIVQACIVMKEVELIRFEL